MLRGQRDFLWRDGERVVRFEEGVLGRAAEVLPEHGFDDFALLSTGRALGASPGAALRERAAQCIDVPAGPVPEVAASGLTGLEDAGHLVALGGGRVIDVAKAIASVTGAAVAAIPTTLSGAELTGIHRLPAGAEERARRLVRPTLVLADPSEMTSAGEDLLRASAMNALAHGAEATYAPFANPVATLCGLQGARLIATALDSERVENDARRPLALGALLCAHAIDSAGLSLHHVVCQTIVRVSGTPHAETNAAVLPHSLDAMGVRAEAEIAAVTEAIGAEHGLAPRIERLAGRALRLPDLGFREDDAAAVIAQAGERLRSMGGPADEAEVEKVLAAASKPL